MTNYFKKNSNLNFGQNNEKNVDGDFGKEKKLKTTQMITNGKGLI